MREVRLSVVCLAVLVSISVCTLFISSQTHPSDFGNVTTGPSDIYPPVPGSTNPNISQNTILTTLCNPKWSTKSIRPSSSYTTALKIKQLKQYGYRDQNQSHYEEDHVISLELGGNPTDPNNLWPEPYTASIQDGGAHTKDKVENYLHAQVCAGTISLAQAQSEISGNWYAVYVQNMKGKAGDIGTVGDPDDEGDNVGISE